MMTAIVPVILAGGAGTRLWPVSRETMPKHLARLIGDESLLQLTAKRLLAHAPADRLVTVAAKSQDLMIRRQLREITPELATHRLLEPVGRNTAAAIALAALYARQTFGIEAVLWVCPSDHLIRKQSALDAAVRCALPAAADGALVTFGISPTRPETGYGYIRAGNPATEGSAVLQVERFVEKPDHATAEAMLAKGDYFWNSGMFLYRADRILEELALHEPRIQEATEQAFDAAVVGDDGGFETPLSLYEQIPSAPIDKAVMERAEHIAVVPCDPDWTDLGSWHSIWEQSPRDDQGNAVYGDVLLNDVENCLVHTSHRLVTCAGVTDLAVIETEDAVLVTDRRRSEPIKQLVASLNGADRHEAVRHSVVEQDWGSASILEDSPDCLVQRLEIAPKWRYRQPGGAADPVHWLVVEGTANILQGEQRSFAHAGDAAQSPAGCAYELANAGDQPLVVIEVCRRRRRA
ncbi:MAG: mannose-1-phosphate guanylyltransferase/mannose-6-phosphate isomerase [Geminicoccaceae bacterium]